MTNSTVLCVRMRHMYDVFAETAVEGTYDVTDKKKHPPRRTDTQAISTTTTKNKKYVRFETECRVETTLSHSKDMTQLENLIHGYKMMNIRK